ncbi:unnamed protein product [Symbiodinium natans]|uniref:Major facilitator superfamily (MFS) profile domain-containing protein n=1 Tax=Symbiodinium natans TaxID=878477 RepID=A0A812IIA3_9DINO|nr:unnamed protein product [Symbiodinium natans]
MDTASPHLCQDLQDGYRSCHSAHKTNKHGRGTVLWMCITAYQLIYSMITTSFALTVLPREAERLNSEASSLWLAIYVMICGATQLICPIAGMCSDRLSSRWGRRRPILLAGSVVASGGFMLVYFASLLSWPIMFMVGLLVTEMALNVAYAAHAALPADLSTASTRDVESTGSCRDAEAGIVSGIIALHSFLGAVLAMAVIELLRGQPLQTFYIIYAAGVVFCSSIVCTLAKEERSNQSSAFPSGGEILSAYTLDLPADLDFFWVCTGRLLFYTSQAVIVFMEYFIRDMFEAKAEATVISRLITLVLIGQLVGAAVALPSSRLSDSFGRKPMVYASCSALCATFLTFISAPHFGWYVMEIGAVLYGLGAGSYMSVDYALALKCLPASKDSAQAFGLWGIAGFLGSCLGPLLVGGVLFFFPQAGSEPKIWHRSHFQYKGYALGILSAGALPALAVIRATTHIRREV